MKHVRWDTALGVVVFVDMLRVLLPSLITLFGQAGGTPPEYMGLFALAWFLPAMAVPWSVSIVSARKIALVAGCGLIVARIVMQAGDGGERQLYTAGVGVALGLVWLTATTTDSRDTTAVLRGFLTGLGIATMLHAALADIDLAWREPAFAVPLLVVELAAFGVLLLRTRPETSTAHAVLPLAACGPVLLLWGMFLGNTAHFHRMGGVVAVAAGSAATVLWVWWPTGRPRSRRHRIVAAAVLVAAVGFLSIDGLDTAYPGLGVLVTLSALFSVAVLLREATTVDDPVPPSRRGHVTALSMLGFLILTFAYYAAFDLGYPNWWVPPLTAVFIGIVGVAGTDVGEHAVKRPAILPVAFTAAAAVATALVAPLWQQSSPPGNPPPDRLRVAAYNIRMGYDLSGRLALDRQADVLAALNAHVIALSEVDRGWFLNGGHDNLRRLADRLDMELVWAPADGNHWGDAVLTNLKTTGVKRHTLVDGGPTGAQALELTLNHRGSPVTFIATHLQPPPDWEPLAQVEQLARIVADAAETGPVVLAGDLNIEPDTPPWDVLFDAGLTDPFARPFPTMAGDAVQQIDHILVTGRFDVYDAANPDVPYSDHRPIAVTLFLEEERYSR